MTTVGYGDMVPKVRLKASDTFHDSWKPFLSHRTSKPNCSKCSKNPYLFWIWTIKAYSSSMSMKEMNYSNIPIFFLPPPTSFWKIIYPWCFRPILACSWAPCVPWVGCSLWPSPSLSSSPTLRCITLTLRWCRQQQAYFNICMIDKKYNE